MSKNFYGFRLLFVTTASLVFLAVFYSVYFAARYFLGVKSEIFFVSMLALSFSFVISNFFVNKLPGKISYKIYHASAALNGLVFYLFPFSILLWIIYFASNYFLLGLDMYNITVTAYASVFLLNIYGLYNFTNTKIANIIIPIKNLPDYWLDKKAAFISDTHYGAIHSEKSAEKLVKIINKINPDYLFHTGDFFDGPKIDFSKISDEYKKLNNSIKKYFVSGNHDEYAEKVISDPKKILRAISDSGFIITDGKLIQENGMQIIGIDYDRSESPEKIKDNFIKNNYDKNKPSIALKHVPKSIDLISELGADLMLCGHTHNGQVFPINFITKYIYKGFDFGLKYKNNLAVYTTSGVGSWGPPQRIGTRSEIIVMGFGKK